MSDNNFQYKSYQLHEQSYAQIKSEEDVLLYENWLNRNTTDVWRNLRMLKMIDPLLKHFPGSKWLAVGDGRYGTSSTYIEKNGGHALATDIDTSLLEIAVNRKWISSYQYANAEALPFKDEEFDFSFCKQAYHHFPRAYIGIYEMLRVSRKAVILVEPHDWIPSPIPRRILQVIKRTLKQILGMSSPHPDTNNFEADGNYIFTLSLREIQKIALGLRLPNVAFKRFHDVYIEGTEKENIDSTAPLFKKIKRKIYLQNLIFHLGLNNVNQIAAIFFKLPPSEELMNDLKTAGFTIITLPTNPFSIY